MLSLGSRLGGSFHGWAMPRTPHTRLAVAPHLGRLTKRTSLLPPVLGRRFAGVVFCNANGARKHEEDRALLKKRGSEIVDDLRGTCIYLVGMMESGKNTIGKTLAEALGYYFFDSDKLIEEAAGGRTVSQLIEEEDEDSFRDAETEVLKQLSCMGHLVVATGGGIVLRPMNWSYLRHGVTIWLDAPVETLARQVVDVGVESRPLSGLAASELAHSQAMERLSSILKDREPYYADSDATVSLRKVASQIGLMDVNSLTPTMVALEVLEEISKLIKRKK